MSRPTAISINCGTCAMVIRPSLSPFLLELDFDLSLLDDFGETLLLEDFGDSLLLDFTLLEDAGSDEELDDSLLELYSGHAESDFP